MTKINLDAYLKTLTDAELIQCTDRAVEDLKEASQNQNESPWHESCFAACVVYAEEMARRGLRKKTPESATIR